ncbi:MAG: hypothetical protein HC888_04010 [Candidatus Competibacteraceae bacterium]|nr:hypothetical protein [Candidatus Competibacteraceae bacterium]
MSKGYSNTVPQNATIKAVKAIPRPVTDTSGNAPIARRDAEIIEDDGLNSISESDWETLETVTQKSIPSSETKMSIEQNC